MTSDRVRCASSPPRCWSVLGACSRHLAGLGRCRAGAGCARLRCCRADGGTAALAVLRAWDERRARRPGPRATRRAGRALHPGSAAGRADRAMLRGVRRARAAGRGHADAACWRAGAAASADRLVLRGDRPAGRRGRGRAAACGSRCRATPATVRTVVAASDRGGVAGGRGERSGQPGAHDVVNRLVAEHVARGLERGRPHVDRAEHLVGERRRRPVGPRTPAPPATPGGCSRGQRRGELRVGRGLRAAEVERAARVRRPRRGGRRRRPSRAARSSASAAGRRRAGRRARALKSSRSCLSGGARAVHHRRGAQEAHPGAGGRGRLGRGLPLPGDLGEQACRRGCRTPR